MLVQLFRSNRPGVLLLLLLLVPALFRPHLLAAAPDLSTGMPLARLFGWLFGLGRWVHGAVVLALVAILAIQVTVLMNETELAVRRNHLPGLLVPLAVALAISPGAAGAAFLGTPFVIWAMHRTWSISSGGKALGALFDAGILIGLAALCYMPYAFLLVVVWASVSVIRPFQWREYLVPFLGVVVSFYLAWGVHHLLDTPSWDPLRTVAASTIGPGRTPDGYGWTVGLVLVPLMFISMLRFTEYYGRGVVREQNIRSAFIALVLTLVLLAVLVQLITGLFPVAVVAIPGAVLATFAFLGTRRAWVGEATVLCLLVLAIWSQYTGS